MTTTTYDLRLGVTYTVLHRLVDALRGELECRGDAACRYDVIVSQSPTQRGADLRGPDSQGRVWVRAVQETSPTTDGCPSWLWVDIEVAVLRCHTVAADDDKSLPGEDVYASEALRVERDRQSVMAAARQVRPRLSIVSWRPYGPQASAVGSITTFRFRRAA